MKHNLNLKTDLLHKKKKNELEAMIDELIEDSIKDLTSKFQDILINQREETRNEVINLLNDDLEKKRIEIKKYFITRLEEIDIQAHKKAMQSF